jgi:hypothetical protein
MQIIAIIFRLIEPLHDCKILQQKNTQKFQADFKVLCWKELRKRLFPVNAKKKSPENAQIELNL